MRHVTAENFLESAKLLGIGFDPRYPAAKSLAFLPPTDNSRFWLRPDRPPAWPHFISTILNVAGIQASILAYPKSGTWPGKLPADNQLDRTQAELAGALGLPEGWKGALEFNDAERERLIALLIIQFLEPVNDLLLIPADGKTLITFSHHDVVHISCPTAEEMKRIVADMAAADYALPEELPDPTFKRPSWMKRT